MVSGNGGQPMEILTLALHGEVFAVEVKHVREILDLVPVTEVPNSQAFLDGLINVRGRVIPLADLRLKFGIEQTPPTIDSRIVVLDVDIDGEPTIIGIRADKVYEITEVPASGLEETPRIGMRWRSEYIRCIAKRGSEFITVLNVERIFASSETKDAAFGCVPATPHLSAA
ncbi:MAG TPA: chemotaxis protein CheW [Rhodopila sp.]|jgi:purine-binding chemotaxis protein CheW|nr:chemotaxis protein CheW [Rhodopila sp.]